MARLEDGRIAFARGVMPGDVVSPNATTGKKGYVCADSWTLVRPSPMRVKAPCPIAAACGGCDWMSIERTAQVRHKGAVLRDALERIGRFTTLPPELPILAAGPDVGYRSRVRFHVDTDGRVGFFAKQSHDLVDVEHCLVCRPEVDRALTALRALSRRALAAFVGVDVRAAADGSVALGFEPRSGTRPEAETRESLALLRSEYRVTIGGSTGVFTQVNPDVNAALVDAVVDGARARQVVRFCELYAGAGNFTLPLLAANMTGLAVERDVRAVRAAKKAAADAGLPESTFVAGDAGRVLAGLHRQERPFDLVLLDPPRRGAKEVLADVVRLGPTHVAMCSCDPVTLARDLATLSAAGYELGDVRGFDMFPHTHHLEALAWMARGTSNR